MDLEEELFSLDSWVRQYCTFTCLAQVFTVCVPTLTCCLEYIRHAIGATERRISGRLLGGQYTTLTGDQSYGKLLDPDNVTSFAALEVPDIYTIQLM